MNIVYLSGTGNTKFILDLLKENLEKKHIDVNLIPIKEAKDLTELDGDTIGIAYPIYGFTTPSLITKWAKELKPSHQKVFIINTGADYISINHNASRTISKILNKKGFNVFYNRILVMPSNWLMPYDDHFIKQLTEASVSKVNNMCDDIINETRRLYSPSMLVKIVSTTLGYFEGHFGARMFGQSLKANNNCTNCGQCINECPSGNIHLKDQKPVFGHRCVWCMRCIYACQQNAIHSRGLSLVVLKNGYNLQRVIDDQSITADYVTPHTKGYYKHFYPYLNDEKL